ncbi:AraC family transcriptional regulator [Dinoroseobacter sp. S375]|uniref:AraC family transcriptional regulator n=1 Tax=Dinoroseobacter sp. S375 TaxID=3415136 RepID=UPI003C79A0AD
MSLTLRHRDYLRPPTAFHFARVSLGDGPIPAPHGQDFHEMFFVLDGMVQHRINGTRIALPPRSLCFMRPQDRHGLGGPARLVNVLIAPDSLTHLLARYPELDGRTFWSDGALPVTLSLDADQASTMTRALERLEVGPRSQLAIESVLLELHTRILRPLPALPGGLPGWLTRTLRAAEDPEVFARGPGALAEIAGKSPAYLARSFRAHLGATPTDWINARRMAHAARLMTGTDLSLTRVAEACGIETPSHFQALFKAHHGAPPARWRRAHRRDVVQPGERRG